MQCDVVTRSHLCLAHLLSRAHSTASTFGAFRIAPQVLCREQRERDIATITARQLQKAHDCLDSSHNLTTRQVSSTALIQCDTLVAKDEDARAGTCRPGHLRTQCRISPILSIDGRLCVTNILLDFLPPMEPFRNFVDLFLDSYQRTPRDVSKTKVKTVCIDSRVTLFLDASASYIKRTV